MAANISDVDDCGQVEPANSPTDAINSERDPARSVQSSSSETTSSSDDERSCKKRRDPKVTVDPRVDALYNQVSALTSFIMHQQGIPNGNFSKSVEVPAVSEPDFLVNPSVSGSKLIDLGTCKTDFDDRNHIKPADESRLKQLIDLQHFNSPSWQHVRYRKALNDMIAQPGFCNLKINDEMCCLNKGKDYLAPTELVVAALTNALLYQRELLQTGLQGLVNWAHNNPAELNPNNMFIKITETFGKSSLSYKLSEQVLQILCGKRAECIEIRRQRLISEIPNKNIQAALLNVPPSEEFLFDRTRLTSLINSLGGPLFWIPQSKDKPNLKRKFNEITPSSSQSNTYNQHKNKSFQDNSKKQYKKRDYKNKNSNNNKQNSFRNNRPKKI